MKDGEAQTESIKALTFGLEKAIKDLRGQIERLKHENEGLINDNARMVYRVRE